MYKNSSSSYESCFSLHIKGLTKPFSLQCVFVLSGDDDMLFIFGFLFIAVAILNIIYPSFGWYLRYGWMVKGDSEPSDAYLLMSRISSIIVLIVFLFYVIPFFWIH
jgi:hypothetical protein